MMRRNLTTFGKIIDDGCTPTLSYNELHESASLAVGFLNSSFEGDKRRQEKKLVTRNRAQTNPRSMVINATLSR